MMGFFSKIRDFTKSVCETKDNKVDIQDLITEARSLGLESGFSGDEGQQEAFRDQVGADLGIREQDCNGALGPTTEQLQGELSALVESQTSLDANLAGLSHNATPTGLPAEWNFGWRNAFGCVLGCGLIGVLFMWFGKDPGFLGWCALALFAGLLIVGPRILSTGLCFRVSWWSEVLDQFRLLKRRRAVGRRIQKMTEEIASSRCRWALHVQWVEERVRLVMSHFELQRCRGESAARVITERTAAQNKQHEEEKELAYDVR